MAPKAKEPHQEGIRWVKYHLGDQEAFAAFAGADYAAWKAFVYSVEMYTLGGYSKELIGAMNGLLRCVQPKICVMTPFVQVIPMIGDWSHVAELWPLASEGISLLGSERVHDIGELCAIERTPIYDHSGAMPKVAGHRLHQHGKNHRGTELYPKVRPTAMPSPIPRAVTR